MHSRKTPPTQVSNTKAVADCQFILWLPLNKWKICLISIYCPAPLFKCQVLQDKTLTSKP